MNTAIVAVLVCAISTIAGWLISTSKKVEKPVKVMLFVLYFWLFFFLQVIIVAILYYFGFLVLTN